MAKRKQPIGQIEKFRATFFEECAERLTEIEDLLEALRNASEAAQPELLNELFRAVHSIKGGAGAFNYDDIVKISHALEAALDLMRSRRIQTSADTIERMVDGRDLLADIVDRVKSGKKAVAKRVEETVRSLETLSTDIKAEGADGAEAPVEESAPGADQQVELKRFAIKFKPTARLFEAANDPLLIVRELRELGGLKTSLDTNLLPPLEDLNPLESYLMWTFELTTLMPRETVEDVFEFVADACALRIEEIPIEEPAATDEAEATPSSVTTAAAPSAPPPAPPPSSDKSVASVEPSQPPAKSFSARKITSVRVDLDRIDTLVNMVGELVITQAMLEQYGESINLRGSENLHRGIETMSSHMRDLQEGVMAVRMQPVKTVFSRMPRLVRELSRKLGKKVRLTLRGEDTEVDKTIIELLSDPLTHMIRNSLDHGLEMPAERIAANKPEEAEIILSADQRSGRIIIEVSDDGAGINRERVLGKAIERGFVGAADGLQPEEIDDLIFAPGFSTAEEVTDVSGRGVGMDVVRRSILELGGRVTVVSTPGHGARFVMALPLTLAVMDGMIVRVGDEHYILPLACIIESLRPAPDEVQEVMGQAQFIQHRGEYIPLISLASLFEIDGGNHDPCEGLVVFVETGMGKILGLIVDDLVGQKQVVIKSLEENYLSVEGVSAATILGDGHVALILDVDGLEGMIVPVHKLQALAVNPNMPDSEVSP